MGYTHYYYRQKELDKKKFQDFKDDVVKLHRSLPEHTNSAGGYHTHQRVIIKGGDGTGSPHFSIDGICFNGDKEKDMYHETFNIPRVHMKERVDENGLIFDFCKTARKPYDILVCASLIALKKHFGNDVKVSSDGDEEEWQPAIDFFEEVLGKKAPKRLFSE